VLAQGNESPVGSKCALPSAQMVAAVAPPLAATQPCPTTSQHGVVINPKIKDVCLDNHLY